LRSNTSAMATSLMGRFCGQGIAGGAGAPAATTDQGDLDEVAAGRVHARQRRAHQDRRRGKLAAVFDEFRREESLFGVRFMCLWIAIASR